MAYSESDTRSKLIDPSIKDSGWLESNIVREYYFTDGRKLIGGKWSGNLNSYTFFNNSKQLFHFVTHH